MAFRFRGPGVCASDENWASGASRSCARRSWRKIKSSELRVGARANCIIKQARQTRARVIRVAAGPLLLLLFQ